MNITITDFWTRLSNSYEYKDFTIKSDWYSSQQNSIYLGKGKGYIYTERGNQLAVVLVDDTFYLDFAFAQYTKPVIEQQVWILNCIEETAVDYKIEFVSLWEKFKLPTAEQLNAFAQVYKEQLLNPVVEVPVVTTSQSQVEDYAHSVEELGLSTGLSETDLHPRSRNLSEYIEWNQAFIHSTLNDEEVLHHSTVIHNYHNPVVQSVPVVEDLNDITVLHDYEEALRLLVDNTDIPESDLIPTLSEDLDEYVESIESFSLSREEIQEYATIVYNYHHRFDSQ